MKRRTSHSIVIGLAASAFLASLSGCEGYDWGLHNWFNPSQPFRKPDQATVNLIYDRVGPADQTTELVPNATFPTAEDLEWAEADYRIGPSDILRVSVLDLFQEGLETVLDRQVSHSGYIDLPLLSQRVRAWGLSQEELADDIKARYRAADILRDPTVSVMVTLPRQNTFSILGAVGRPGPYNIIRKDLTLLQALAMAGGVNQVNIDWIYVIRPKRPDRGKPPTPERSPATTVPTLDSVEQMLKPSTSTAPAPTTSTRPATVPTSGPSLEDQLKEFERHIPGARRKATGATDKPVALLSEAPVGPTTGGTAATKGAAPTDLKTTTGDFRYIYSGGKWIRVPLKAKPRTAPASTPAKAELPASAKDPFGWMTYDMSHLARIIAINLPELRKGNPRMNIIVRDNDVIHIPPLEIGEFYVMGEVLRPGVYSLTGRRVTVKMAIAAAGNLGALSWPNNSILIRRIGRDQEQMQHLKLQDIMAGREPDFLLKPNDVIAVGSYWAAPWLAVWRNAFRMTYGFGFIYDRNFSERSFEIPLLYRKPGFRPNTN